jgi:uncharacterized integral membrane protein (TIGR00698 family)
MNLPKERISMEDKGIFEKIMAIVPGMVVMVGTLYVLRIYVEPWMNEAIVFGSKGWLVKVMSLNYILLSIIAGMFYRNVLFGGKIPGWAEEGFRTTRLFIKIGVIMLGTLYTFDKLLKVGGVAITLIVSFVFGTAIFILWLGRRLGADRSVTSVMAAACGVCGVSASVATAPGVRAKPVDLALSIATILGFGIASMFVSPYIGKLLSLSDYQFGAWVGTGILNSGQVLATCLAFNPNFAPGTAVAYGEIWNVVRVISIPFVVFFITAWYWKGEADAEHVSLSSIIMSKFPIFVIGFIGMTALSSLHIIGAEGSETLHLMRQVMAWVFGIGLVGLGAYIDVREIMAAGGKPLRIGIIAGFVKYILALIVILAFIPKEGAF